MTTTNKLLFIAGSARKASLNRKLARLGVQIAMANGISATFADLADYPMPLYHGDEEEAGGPPENARKLKALMLLHQGIFIAAPEYNASITPLLKNTLDWISRVPSSSDLREKVYKTRVFALGAASPGKFGGIRGLTAVRHTLELGLGALVLPDQIAVAGAGSAFNEQGHLSDKTQQEMFKTLIQKLARATNVLHGEE